MRGGRADDEDSMLCPSALPLRRMRSRNTRAPLHFLDTSPPGPWKGRFEVACAESPHPSAYEKREEPFGFFPLLERKTDFRPKHISQSQSAHYVKHFPQRSLPRCGHHALVCIPMLSTKIRIIFTQFKNAIPVVFCIRNPVYFHPCLSTRSIHLRIAPCRNRRQYWVWEKSCQKRSSHYGQQDYSA